MQALRIPLIQTESPVNSDTPLQLRFAFTEIAPLN